MDNFLYIDRIAVNENYRGQNIGKEIYQHVENEISFNFHEKNGFREFSTKKYSDDYEVSFQKKNLI